MCGIVGIVTRDRAPVNRPTLDRALDAIAHRGPDMRDVATGPGYGLGHVRLAILDLDRRASQPMWDSTGRWAVVYNGHVFNQQALRRELVGGGRMFRTTSDSEVVLEALVEWGPAALNRLRGQFALAWYDTVDHRLLLARDPLGIKPLYYWQRDGTVVFASQPPAITSHPAFRPRLNVRAVSSFLSYRQVVGNEWYYDGIHELPPGSHAEVHDGRLAQRRFWSLADVRAPRVRPAELRARIAAAVNEQTAADVPVALLLSGGLDSSILAAEASQVYPSLIAYTASIPDRRIDESDFAARVALAFEIKHIRVPVGPDHHLEHLQRLVRQKGAPLGMHNELEVHVLAEAVARQAKVVLCGEGADELFAGYGRIFRLPYERATRWRTSSVAPFDLFYERYTYFPEQIKRQLFDPGVWDELDGDAGCRGALRAVFDELSDASLFDRIWWVFVHVHLRGLLSMIDAMTMAAGIEARVPFLSPPVVEAAHGLPARDKLRWRRPWSPVLAFGRSPVAYSERLDTTKYVLRRAYEHVLPAEVLRRPKAPFPVPLNDWYAGAGMPHTRALLLGDGARLVDIMRRPALDRFLGEAGRHCDDATGRRLFQLVNLELFLRHDAEGQAA